jgi:hypothetical protein
MAKPRSQNRTINDIKTIAENHGYKTDLRGKDKKTKDDADVKKFLPDLIATPFKGKRRQVFEVEKTISNNTVFKSIASLLYFLTKNDDESEGYLVVPNKHLKFSSRCLDAMKEIIRRFSKKMKGQNPKIRVDVITFEQIAKDEKKVTDWDSKGRKGQPPKCKYLPRPK